MTNFRCFSPRKVYLRNGKTVMASCGSCAACLNRKASRYTDACAIEESKSKFCYFVTLTYSNEHLPLLEIVKLRNSYYFINQTERMRLYYVNDVVDAVPFQYFGLSPASLNMYYDKFKLPDSDDFKGLIPYLCRKDVQNFMKRLRYYISNYTDEKIRYFSCGEYGPRTFRPHYHLLLFFDSPRIKAHIRKCIRASWKYGRIDVQLSAQRCSSYVAKYVNSFSHIPRLYTFKSVRPFCLHSSHLAESVCKFQGEEVYGHDYRELNENPHSFGQKLRNVSFPNSLACSLFPKGYRFSDLSYREFLNCCIFYRTALEDVAPRYFSPISLSKVIPYFNNFHSHQIFNSLFGETVQSEESVLNVLQFSAKFLKLCKQFDFRVEDLARNIYYFYSRKDYYCLTEMYRQQQDFISKFGIENRIFLSNYYDNIDFSKSGDIYTLDKKTLNFFDSIGITPYFVNEIDCSYRDNPEFKEFVFMQSKINKDSVKHKKLNDENLIFCYG